MSIHSRLGEQRVNDFYSKTPTQSGLAGLQSRWYESCPQWHGMTFWVNLYLITFCLNSDISLVVVWCLHTVCHYVLEAVRSRLNWVLYKQSSLFISMPPLLSLSWDSRPCTLLLFISILHFPSQIISHLVCLDALYHHHQLSLQYDSGHTYSLSDSNNSLPLQKERMVWRERHH